MTIGSVHFPSVSMESTIAVFNTTDTPSLSHEHELKLLQHLSDEKALLFLPVIIFMALLMVVGVLGNLLVLYIYCFRFPSRSANCFFITMAIFNLLASAIGMPIDIYDVRNHYTFHISIVCKIFRYVENIVTYGSAIILVEIAFDRYLKICRPLEFSYMSRCRVMCIIALVIALIVSAPSLFLFGITHEPVNVNGFNITGNDCSVAEEYKGTIFQKVFYGLLMLIFIVVFGLIAGFYIRIWIEIKRRKGITIGDRVGSLNDAGKSERPILQKQRSLPSESEDESSVFTNKNVNLTPKYKSQRPVSRSISHRSKLTSISAAVSRMKVSRTTRIFIAVTLVFVLSYLPGIAVLMARALSKRLEHPSKVEEVIIKLFSRFHYLNNAANPIIYSFLNVNFRKQCTKLFQSIIFCCKSTMSDRNSVSVSSGRNKKLSSKQNDSGGNSDHLHEVEMRTLNES